MHKIERDLCTTRSLLHEIVVAFDGGTDADVERLISIARNDSSTDVNTKLHDWHSLQDIRLQVNFYERLVQNVSDKFGKDVSTYLADSLKLSHRDQRLQHSRLNLAR
ncbi:hypothetical protein ABHI18_012666 [Aspergillus niger]